MCPRRYNTCNEQSWQTHVLNSSQLVEHNHGPTHPVRMIFSSHGHTEQPGLPNFLNQVVSVKPKISGTVSRTLGFVSGHESTLAGYTEFSTYIYRRCANGWWQLCVMLQRFLHRFRFPSDNIIPLVGEAITKASYNGWAHSDCQQDCWNCQTSTLYRLIRVRMWGTESFYSELLGCLSWLKSTCRWDSIRGQYSRKNTRRQEEKSRNQKKLQADPCILLFTGNGV